MAILRELILSNLFGPAVVFCSLKSGTNRRPCAMRYFATRGAFSGPCEAGCGPSAFDNLPCPHSGLARRGSSEQRFVGATCKLSER